MGFDRQLALEAADLIRLLYADALKPTIDERRTDTQALIAKQAGRTFVVFPGTSGCMDVITDLRAGKEPWGAGRVHAGFRAAWRSVQPAVLARLEGESDVVIAGHSLGGALATLAAEALNDLRLEKVAAVYTFGSPRVGNGPFARDYDARLHDETYRIVNAHDPIPRIPWLLGTYRHVGTKVFLDDAGNIELSPTLWRGWEVLPVRVAHPEAVVQEMVSLSAHHIQTYMRKIREGVES